MTLTRKVFTDVAIKRKDDGVYTFRITTPARDRDNDIVEPLGIDLSAYRTNPVVLFNHDRDRVIGQAVALRVDATGIVADMTFSSTAFPQEIKTLVDEGILRATSIGFDPLESEPLAGGGLRFTEVELHEFSIVTLPSNREALRVRGLLSDESLVPLASAKSGDPVMNITDWTSADSRRRVVSERPITVQDALDALGSRSDVIDFELDDLKAALVEEVGRVRNELRAQIRTEVARVISRAKGRVDDFGGDPAPAQRRHHRRGGGEDFDIDLEALQQGLQGAVREATSRGSIIEMTRTALARLHGRVD